MEFSKAKDALFEATDNSNSPWWVVQADDKKRARLNIISHLLASIPYKSPKRDKVKLPKRQKAHGYKDPDYPYKVVPEKF